MKHLPEINDSFAPLYTLLTGPVRMQLLLAGIELKVFNLLTHEVSAADVAKEKGAHPDNMRVLLDALTAMALVKKSGGRYVNMPLARDYLVEESDTYLGEMMATLASLQHSQLADIAKMVMGGPLPLPPGSDLRRREKWARSTGYLANYQRAGMAQDAVRFVSRLPEFSGFQKMLDLGGGPGLIGISLVRAHPHMTGVIFDLPGVVDAAGEQRREYGVEDRIAVMAGDYNQDPFGSGYDLIWASMNLYYVRDGLEAFMERVHEALNPGGIFISLHEGLGKERTRPEAMVLNRLTQALMDRDVSFDKGRIARALIRSGFHSVQSEPMETPVGPMEIDVARRRG